MTPKEIQELVEKSAETLFRSPDGWPSMQRHDKPGSPRNIIFLWLPQVTKDIKSPEELTEAMRKSYKAEVLHIIERVTGVRIE